METDPPSDQDKNGLSKRNCQMVLRMAWGWLSSTLLPITFWWQAPKRSVEVSNYIAIKIDNITTTLFEIVFQEPPDFCNLFPLFRIGYVTIIKDSPVQ